MRAIASLVSFLLVLDPALAQDQTKGCPMSGEIIVDGQAKEWPMNWMNDDEKIFSYNVCADDKNLYVRVSTKDFYAKRKMAAFGFTLWIDPNGKKKKKLGLRFPVGGAEAEERREIVRNMDPPGNSAGEQVDFQKEVDRKLIADLEVLELIGLADEPITATRSGITNGIKVGIGMDTEGEYVYEALIPFKSYRLSRASLSELAIGFETGKFVVPKAKVTAKDAALQDRLSPKQMSRMQGYESMMANPKLAYPSYAWTTLNLN